jgi:hypothetical protein
VRHWAARHLRALRSGLLLALLAFLLIEVGGHRAGIRQFLAWLAVAAVAVLVLLLAGGGTAWLRRSRRPAVTDARVPQPPAVQAAARVHPPAPPQPDLCAEGCGRLAETVHEGALACRPCAARLADPSAYLPAVTRPDREADGYQLTQPPVVLNGETIGEFDMAAFEEAHRND